MKIIADSSCNITELPDVSFEAVPLKINIGSSEWLDLPGAPIEPFLDELKSCDGNTGTACPSIGEWMKAFGNEKEIVAAALTSAISGCYNAGMIAAAQYTFDHPDRRVFILDSLSTGPELELIVEKYRELILQNLSFDEIVTKIQAYKMHTHLAFELVTLNNFARNGRVSPTLAKLVQVLNIRIVGKAADGMLTPVNKVHGEPKALRQILKNMQDTGYNGGRVRIRHTDNHAAADRLAALITGSYPQADVRVGCNRLLCAYYAEHGSLLIGYESKE